MNTPRVSICIPACNRPHFLREALASCAAQTFRDFEICVSDDSRDASSEDVLAAWDWPQKRYMRNASPLGIARNSQQARAMGQGEFVKILNDDDLLKPEALALQVAALEKYPEAGVAMSPLDIVDETARPILKTFYGFRRVRWIYRYAKQETVFSGRAILRDFLTRLYPCCVPSGVLFRRSVLDRAGEFDARCGAAWDLALFMAMALEADFVYVPSVLASWRSQENSDTVVKARSGYDLEVFYYLAAKFVEEAANRGWLNGAEKRMWERKASRFATKRAFLNFLAAWSHSNMDLAARTWTTIMECEQFMTNWLTLPFVVSGDIVSSLRSHLPGGLDRHQQE